MHAHEKIRHLSYTFGWVNCTSYCRNAIESSLFKQWLKNTETGILANGAMSLAQVLIQVWILCEVAQSCYKLTTPTFLLELWNTSYGWPNFAFFCEQNGNVVSFCDGLLAFSVHFVMRGLHPSGGFFTCCWRSGTYLDASRSFVTHPFAIMVYEIVASNG